MDRSAAISPNAATQALKSGLMTSESPSMIAAVNFSKLKTQESPSSKNFFSCAYFRPSPLTALAKSFAKALDGFDLTAVHKLSSKAWSS